MPRYVIHRDLGDITDAQLDAAAKESERLRLSDFPEIGWEHSHVIRVEGSGLRALCVYSAPDPAAIRAYSERAGLPVDGIHEIHADLTPEADSAA